MAAVYDVREWAIVSASSGSCLNFLKFFFNERTNLISVSFWTNNFLKLKIKIYLNFIDLVESVSEKIEFGRKLHDLRESSTCHCSCN